MSASDQLAIEAQNFHYGFLAAGLQDILDRALGSPLTTEEVGQLDVAASFLGDVIGGVQLISEGAPAAASRHPVAALGQVLDPITAIEKYRDYSGSELLNLFGQIQNFLGSSSKAGQLSGTAAQKDVALEVFSALTESILSYLQRQVRSHRDPV